MAELIKNEVRLDINPTEDSKLILPIQEPEFIEVSDEEYKALNLVEDTEEPDVIDDDEEEVVEEVIDKPKTKVTKKEETSNVEETTEESEEVDPIVYFGKTLKSNGIFSSVDDEDIENISSLEDLAEVMEKQVEATVEEWKKPAMQDWVNTLIKSGYIKPEQVNVGNYLKETDIKDEKSAERFIRYFYDGKLGEKAIQKLIDKADDIIEDAKALVPDYNDEQKVLETRAAKELERKEKEQEMAREKLYQDIKRNVDSVNEFIPGKKINSATKEKVYNSIGNVWQEINNDIVTYLPRIAYLKHYGMLDGKFDTIVKVTESDTNKKFKTLLDSKPIRGTDSSSKRQHSSKEDDEFRDAMRASLKTK